MADLLDRIRGELRERLDASREAVEEYRRLEAALEALGDQAAEQPEGNRLRRRPQADEARPGPSNP